VYEPPLWDAGSLKHQLEKQSLMGDSESKMGNESGSVGRVELLYWVRETHLAKHFILDCRSGDLRV